MYFNPHLDYRSIFFYPMVFEMGLFT
jgi:hypothetical protein